MAAQDEMPKVSETLVLQERDKVWIRAAHRFKSISTDQAQRMTGHEIRRALSKRLQMLWRHDYLDRPTRITKELFSYANKRHTIHCLGQRGAEYLEKVEGERMPSKKGWTSANAKLTSR